MWWKGALPSWLAYKCRYYEDAVPRHHSKIFCVRQWCAWSNRVSTVYKHKTIRTESAGLTVRSYPFSVTISVSLGFVCVARRFVWLAATMADATAALGSLTQLFFPSFSSISFPLSRQNRPPQAVVARIWPGLNYYEWWDMNEGLDGTVRK